MPALSSAPIIKLCIAFGVDAQATDALDGSVHDNLPIVADLHSQASTRRVHDDVGIGKAAQARYRGGRATARTG